MDLATGAFHQIGPDTPVPLVNLVWLKESLLSVSESGNLSKVNLKTDDVTKIGPTGLGFNVFELAEVRGKFHLADFDNNLNSRANYCSLISKLAELSRWKMRLVQSLSTLQRVE